jgi:hypothetical protein
LARRLNPQHVVSGSDGGRFVRDDEDDEDGDDPR